MNYKRNTSTVRYDAAKQQFMWGCKTSLKFQTAIWSTKVVSGKKKKKVMCKTITISDYKTSGVEKDKQTMNHS